MKILLQPDQRKWIIFALLLQLNSQQLNSQVLMPMMGVAGPPILAAAIPLPVIEMKLLKTTTTTTEKTVALAMPVPIPIPVGVPPPPPICPRSVNKVYMYPPPPPLMPVVAPITLPAPTPILEPRLPGPISIEPPPVIVVPLPPFIRQPPIIHHRYTETTYSSEFRCRPRSGSSSSNRCIESSNSDSSAEHFYRKRHYGRKRVILRRRKGDTRRKSINQQNMRRDIAGSISNQREFKRPVLAYVSDNGDVLIKKRISDKDAKILLKR